MATKSKKKAVKTTTATGPANVKSKNAPAQATNAAVGGGGMKTSSAKKKKKAAKKKKKGDPVDVVSGAVVEDVLDLYIEGPVPFMWERSYASGDAAESGPLGRGGWTHGYHQWIEPEGDGWLVVNHEGADLELGPIPEGGFAFNRANRVELYRAGDRFELREHESGHTREYAALRPGGPAMLQAIADAFGNRVTLTYDGERLARITDTAGRVVHVVGDDRDRVAALDVEVDGRVTRRFAYAYSDDGDLVAAADALGRPIRYAYDGKHRLVQKWLRNGFGVRYVYDPLTDRCVKTVGDGGLHQVEFTYDLDKGTTTTHAEPQPRVFTWDAQDNLLAEATFDGRFVEERAWDDDHHLLAEKNAAGEEHTYAYDAFGGLVKHVDPAGNETTYERDRELLRRVVRPNGNQVVLEHDGHGALSAVTTETGARFSVDRDRWGHIVALYGPRGLLERREWDARHQLARVIGPAGHVTTYEYDELGRPTAQRDPLGRVTRIEYDAVGNATALVNADGTRIEHEHDGLDNPVRVRKPGGDLLLEYLGTGALTRVVTEDGGEWRFTYDREEKPLAVVGPKGDRHEFRYDRAGRVAEERTFDGRTLRYGYDLADQLARIDLGDGTYRAFAYDPLGNLVEETSPHGTRTFTRDPEGRLLEAKMEEGPATSTVTLERDAFGRIVSETQDGQTLHYAWDPEDRLVSRALPNGEVTRYAYDLDGDLAAVEHAGHVVRIERDAAGRETSRRIGEAAAVTSAYDAMDRLVAQDVVRPSPRGAAAWEAIARRRLAYDAGGRVLTVDDTRWERTRYDYDAVHNLVGAQRGRFSEIFEYDPTGALVKALRGLGASGEPWTVRRGDVLVRTDSAVYEVDELNRRTRETRLAGGAPTGEVTDYVWDCRDQLREVRLPSGEIARYFYDAYGRRTKKILFPPAPADRLAAAPPARVTRFVWHGDVLAAEMDTEEGTRTFVHEPDTFRPLLQAEQGEVFTYVLDHVGAARELVDARGRIVWAAVYTAWGRLADTWSDPTATHARPVRSPFRLLGQYADDETRLAYTRFRYWDPEVARFISPDPIGLLGGMRPFGFPGSPTVFVDPLGLAIDWTQIPNTPGIYHITTPQGQYYTGSTYGSTTGLRDRLQDDRDAATLIAKKGTVIEFFEIDTGTAKTNRVKNHIVRWYEQTEMNDRENTPIGRKAKLPKKGSWNRDRATQKKNMTRYKKDVTRCGATKTATKKVKNT